MFPFRRRRIIGTTYSYSHCADEIKYLLFRKKVCPKCEGKLKKHKGYTVTGTDTIKIGNMNIKLGENREYSYYFICKVCEEHFPIAELAKIYVTEQGGN